MLLIPKGPGFADGETVQIDEADHKRVIGSGGDSTVYRITHPGLGDLAAKIWKNRRRLQSRQGQTAGLEPTVDYTTQPGCNALRRATGR